MLLLSHTKKIVLLALSLFLVSLSVLFVLSSRGGTDTENLSNNLFGSFFSEHTEEHSKSEKESKDATLVVSKAGEFVSLNTGFTTMFDYAKEDFDGHEFFSFFHPEDLAQFIGNFTKVAQGKEITDVYSGPFRFLSKSGDYRLVIITMNQKKSEIVLQFKDITESVEELKKGEDGKSIRDWKDKDKTRIVVEKIGS